MKVLHCGSSMLFMEEPGDRFREAIPDEAFFLDADNEPEDAEFDDPNDDDEDDDEDDEEVLDDDED